jgi:hypothetical protein
VIDILAILGDESPGSVRSAYCQVNAGQLRKCLWTAAQLCDRVGTVNGSSFLECELRLGGSSRCRVARTGRAMTMVTRTAGDRRTQQHAEICIFRRTIARFSEEDLREDLPGDIHGITLVATTGVIGLITKAAEAFS